MVLPRLEVLWRRALLYLVLGLLTAAVLFPLYWMVNTSFKTTSQFRTDRDIFFPAPATAEQYTTLITHTRFLTWVGNSLTVAVATTLVTVAVSSLAAYAVARLKFPGRHLIAMGVLATYLVPPAMLFIPLYHVLKGIGLINTRLALIAAYPTFTVPFCTWLLMGFLRSLPRDLEEAALVDGCTRFQAFARIILPLARPGILAGALFSFTLAWNEFLYALIFVSDEWLKTYPIGLSELMMGDVYLWGQLMAGALISSLPVVLCYMYLNKYLVGGLTAGAVKG